MGSEVAPEGLVIGPLCAGSGLLLPAGRHAPRRNRSVAIPAAPVHLLQVFLGAEWIPHQAPALFQSPPAIVPMVLVLVAIGWFGLGKKLGLRR